MRDPDIGGSDSTPNNSTVPNIVRVMMPSVADALDKAKASSDAAKEKIAAAKAKIEEARAKVAASKAKIEEARAKIEEARKRAEEARKKAAEDNNTDDTKKKPTRKIVEEYDISPTPLTPSLIDTTPVVITPPTPPAKTAPIDTILFNDDSVPIEVMTDLIFEDIGGQELINIARNDIINGQQVSYTPIKNLSSINQQYNPNNIISLQNTSNKYFANFPIKFEEKIPNYGSGPNGENVYMDQSTGELIIEAVNIESDEQIDVQIVISGTIYEADI
jgi:hypothetical protein